MMESGLPNLPKGWVWTRLEDCVDILDSERVPINAEEREKRKGNIPYYGATGQVGWIDDFIFDEELLLLGEDGAPFLDPHKPSAYIIRGKSWVNNHAHVLRAIAWITMNSTLCHYLNIFDFHGYVTGTTRLKLNQSPMRQIPIPLAPLPEQHRIVGKIEELFTRLDAGVEALKKIKAQLKRYRQAVLKYAFEGKLTQEWRAAHKGEIEPASALLERIKEQRKKEAKGKLKELPPVDTSELPELPEDWAWTNIKGFADLISGQHILKEDYNSSSDGLPYLTGPADFGHKFPIISKWTTNPKVISKYNDVLVTVKGAGVGKVNILNIDKAVISRQLMAIRGDHSNPYYIFFFIDFNFHKLQRLGAGSTVPGIDRETILKMPFPFPPFHEQNKIVEEIENYLSIADNMEKVAEQSLKQSERLRQSILKRAFEGKLVFQDPTDQPAEKLLDRIKEEKAKREAENRREKKHRNKNSKQMELI